MQFSIHKLYVCSLKLRILYNVYEYPYDARLDDCLNELTVFAQFQENLDSFQVQLDINCMNMLFVIQVIISNN